MSKFAFLSSGTGVTVGAGAVAVGAIAVAAYVSGVFSSAPVVDPAANVDPAVQIAPLVQESPSVEVAVEPEAGQIAKRPSFDVVRVETNGAAMIAGSAEAGSTIAIRIDDDVVAQVKADARGKFASFVTLPKSEELRVLTLGDENGQSGGERVIVAPVVEAVDVRPVEPIAVSEPMSAEPDVAEVATGSIEVPDIQPKESVQVELEPVAPLVLLATDEGVRVLQAPDAPKPDAMTSLLGSITYDSAGDVVLTGRGNGDFVRIYLDNRAIATTQIAVNGNWSADLPLVDTGVYALRVDALNVAGEVVGRVETPFKREAAEVLAAATKPEKSVQAITVQPGATLWAIAKERYGSGTLYARVVAANADTIRDPDLIYPGQVFSIPD